MTYQDLVVFAIIGFAIYGMLVTARWLFTKSTEALMKPLMAHSIDNSQEAIAYMAETFQLAIVVGIVLIALAR